MTYKLAINYGLKFLVFDRLEQELGSTVRASMATALSVTLLSYPLDVAQARMASDMSKKPSVFTDAQTKKKGPYL